jgi:hypothetical protein
MIPWLAWGFGALVVVGLYLGLVVAPPDYQQGDSYRIIFVHVPSAWMSLFVYMVMATAGGIGLIWRIKLADVVAAASAPVGATFTFLALVTGSLWGKPMWGTYWVWDARLTSELILLFSACLRHPRPGGRGEHPHHSLLGGVVEHLAPGQYRGQDGWPRHALDHARTAAADGHRVQALLRRRAAGSRAHRGARARAGQHVGA